MSITTLCDVLNARLISKAEDTESDEYATIFYHITLKSPMTRAMVVDAVEHCFQRTDCGHIYDCCGCWFRSSTIVTKMYDHSDYDWIIMESWARNI